MAQTLLLCLVLVLSGLANAETPALPTEAIVPEAEMASSHEQREMTVDGYGQLPLYFIENQGQMEEEVAYYIQGSDKSLYFTPKGITFLLTSRMDSKTEAPRDLYAIEKEAQEDTPREPVERWIVKLEFVDANPAVKPRGENKQEAIFSFFKGKPEDWKTGLSTYGEVVYEDLWPGIDLVYTGTVNKLKYEFRVDPAADPNRIRLRYCGAEEVTVKDSGELVVSTPACSFEDGIPVAYQTIDGARTEVSMAYALEGKEKDDSYIYRFDIGDYDHKNPLILDPVVLIYSGFIDSFDYDSGSGIAVDSQGNAYVTGRTKYTGIIGLPVVVGPDLTFNGGTWDAFVAKVNTSGTGLVYCGYLGGKNSEYGDGIAVDSQGNAYVSGTTASDESTFPVLVGPDLTYNGGNTDAFVAKVNASGTGLVYCGYIGGYHDLERAYGIAVDDQGSAYVTGSTKSSEMNGFPVVVGPDLTFNGDYGVDAFVAKVNASGTGLDYCGYIGGGGDDSGSGIAVDSQGNAYVTGFTYSDQNSFPVCVGPDLTFNSQCDAFVAKVNASGTGLVYCGFIGGKFSDSGDGIAVDSQGNAYVTGTTYSSESFSFPVVFGPDLTFNGGDSDAYVAKVMASGAGLDYCGYIGGGGDDRGDAIAVDSQGHAYVTGDTDSDESTFPVWGGPDLTFNGGDADAYVAKVYATGRALVYCGYLGGGAGDYGSGMAVDGNGAAFITGYTDYDPPLPKFPALIGPHINSFTGVAPFVAKITSVTLTADSTELSVSGGTVNFDLVGGGYNAGRYYLLLASLTGTEPGTPLPGGTTILPLNWDALTETVISRLNSPLFSDFLGILDSSGNETATLNVTSLNPGKIGKVAHFAYLLEGPPWDFASNPVAIEFVP